MSKMYEEALLFILVTLKVIGRKKLQQLGT